MADIIDRAQELENFQREAAIRSTKSLSGRGQARRDCASCGDDIPLSRRNAVPGVRLCVQCQSKTEQRLRR